MDVPSTLPNECNIRKNSKKIISKEFKFFPLKSDNYFSRIINYYCSFN